ncbi:MAG: NAD(P)H-hydrate epimerase [Planctomycetota bacterium]
MIRTRAYLTRELREIDRIAEDEFAMPPLLLMEHAAIGLADVVTTAMPTGDTSPGSPGPVVFVTGRGNNAGDGFAAARILTDRGVPTIAAMTTSAASLGTLATVNYRMAAARGVEMRRAENRSTSLATLLERARPAVVVDAMLGTGLSRLIEGETLAAVLDINQQRQQHGTVVVAADVPTGLDADTGDALPEAVNADITATFAGRKHGFDRADGPACTGTVITVPIGAPPALLDRFGTPWNAVER